MQERKTTYKNKLDIITNCIYGVDIQNIAIEISKLRFFISLLVDYEAPAKIEDFEVLPNLETKFTAANTLIGINLSGGDLFNQQLLEHCKELTGIFTPFTTAKTPREKETIKNAFEAKKLELVKLLVDNNMAGSEVEKVSAWNPFNVCYTSPFFDSGIMFGVDGGFDVVIGNPPYVQLQSNKGALADQYTPYGFTSFARTGDIYQLFYERGIKLVCPKGHLCLITSNKWMRAGYGESTRKFFTKNVSVLQLIDFAGQRVFDSATVDVNIALLQKGKTQQETSACIIKEDCMGNLTDYVRQSSTRISFPSDGQSWVILSDIEQRIKAKIEKMGTPLKDWDISINYGIKTGCNEAFIINKLKRDELIAKDAKSADIIRPILRGRDIKRYGYEFADLYLIATFPSKKYNIDDYPAVRDCLLEYGKEKLEQSGKPNARKKTNNKWFETQDTIAYWEEFSKQKIVWSRLMRISKNDSSNFPRFSFLGKEYFVVDSLCFFTGNDILFLQGILNSEFAAYYFFNNIAILDNGGMQMRQQYIELMPIPHISNIDKQKISRLVEKISERWSLDIDSQLNELIYHAYKFEYNEILHIKRYIQEKISEITENMIEFNESQ